MSAENSHYPLGIPHTETYQKLGVSSEELRKIQFEDDRLWREETYTASSFLSGTMAYDQAKNKTSKRITFITKDDGKATRLNPALNTHLDILFVGDTFRSSARKRARENPPDTQATTAARYIERQIRAYMQGFGLSALRNSDLTVGIMAFDLAKDGILNDTDAVNALLAKVGGNKEALVAAAGLINELIERRKSATDEPYLGLPEKRFHGQLIYDESHEDLQEDLDEIMRVSKEVLLPKLEQQEQKRDLQMKRTELATLLQEFGYQKRREKEVYYAELFKDAR